MNGNSAVYTAVVFALDAWLWILVGHLLFSWIMARMARRRGLSGWPLAWIPMMNLWVMGHICDQYQYVVRGKESRNCIWLPLLAGATEVLLIFGALGLQGRYGFFPALWATLLDVTAALVIVRACLCLYRLYLSCVPRRAVAWLIWSVCVPFLPLVFLCLCKDSEQGMPMRRMTVQTQNSQLSAKISPDDAEETSDLEEDRFVEDVVATEIIEPVVTAREEPQERIEVEQDG